MTRLLGVLAVLGAVLAFGVGSATAITGGRADGDSHPDVGVMIAYDSNGNPLWECSGTLMSSTIFLTAAHCLWSADTNVQAHQVGIWFERNPQVDQSYEKTHSCSGVLDFPCAGADAKATDPSHLHWLKGYSPSTFFTHDVGVVELDQPVSTVTTFGVLPTANQLDGLKTQRGRQDETFTTVGYGAQQSFPGAAGSSKNVGEPVRMVTTTHLVQIDGGQAGDFGVVLSDNASTGGMCFGDSGGPNFLPADPNVVVAVSSGLTNDRCTGTSLAFRLDRSKILGWLGTFGLTVPSS